MRLSKRLEKMWWEGFCYGWCFSDHPQHWVILRINELQRRDVA